MTEQSALAALRDTCNNMIEMSKAKLPLSKPGETLYDTAEGEIAALNTVVGITEAALTAAPADTDNHDYVFQGAGEAVYEPATTTEPVNRYGKPYSKLTPNQQLQVMGDEMINPDHPEAWKPEIVPATEPVRSCGLDGCLWPKFQPAESGGE